MIRNLLQIAAVLGVVTLVGAAVWLHGRQRSRTEEGVHTEVYRHMCVAVHDVPPVFGTKELKAVYDLPVKNWWDEPLEISKITSSCSCTVAKLAAESIAPHGKTTLHVEVSHPPTGGETAISCTLEATNGKKLVHKLTSVAYPLVKLDSQTGGVFLGDLYPGERVSHEARLWIYSPSDTSEFLKIEGVSSTDKCVLAEVGAQGDAELLTNRAGRRIPVPVRIEVAADGTSGVHAALLTLKYQFNKSNVAMHVPVSWSVKPIFSLSPSRLFLKIPNDATEIAAAEFVVSSVWGEQFAIQSVVGAPKGVNVERATQLSASEQLLRVGVNPLEVGTGFWELIIETDHPLQNRLSFPLSIRRIDSDGM